MMNKKYITPAVKAIELHTAIMVGSNEPNSLHDEYEEKDISYSKRSIFDE